MADGDVDLTNVPPWLARLLSARPPGPSQEEVAEATEYLDAMSRDDLVEQATSRGVKVPARASKAKIVEAIMAEILPEPVQPGADRAAPDWRSFVGYYGGEVERGGRLWLRLYLDLDLQNWLIIEREGVVHREDVQNEPGVVPGRVVLWVRPDAVVGRGKRSLSIEGEFLAGAFTRAGDFDLGTAGGGPAAATGVFCDARSVGCCMGRTTGPPR